MIEPSRRDGRGARTRWKLSGVISVAAWRVVGGKTSCGTRVVSDPLKKPKAGVTCEKLRINWGIVSMITAVRSSGEVKTEGNLCVEDCQSATDSRQAVL